MQDIIRDGGLRLMTAEGTCDVILNCQGHRLMAHKIMLSIASPFFQELLMGDQCETSLIVLPDINANIIAHILDYIYTGSVLLHSTVLAEFLTTAKLLKLKIQHDILPTMDKQQQQQQTENDYTCYYPKKYSTFEKCDAEYFNKARIYSPIENEKRLKFSPIILQDERNPDLLNGNNKYYSYQQLETVSKKRATRKMPNLMPISRYQFKTRKGLYNRVFPSPWCPRIIPVTVDPRNDCTSIQSSGSHLPSPPSSVSNGTTHGWNGMDNSSTKENSDYNDEQNDNNNNNNNFKKLSVPLNSISNLCSNEKNTTSSFHYLDSADSVLNLNVTHKNDTSYSNNNNNYEDVSKQQDLITSNNNNNVIYSSAESNPSSCVSSGDTKLEDLCLKTDKSDDDDGGGGGDVKDDCEISDHHKHKPYKCDDCGKQFSQLRNYKYHRSVHEGTKEFAARCPECGKVFNDRGYLSSHLKIHRDRKEYGCPHCPKRFNQRVAYNMHLRIHTGIKPHICPTCGKGFSRKMLLKQHQRVHTGERPYKCPECGKSFADRSNMSLHARLHTGVKPYACNLCSKSFTKKHHLKTHMNYHTGLKPYVCQKCGLTFSQSSNMRTHYKKCVQKEPTIN